MSAEAWRRAGTDVTPWPFAWTAWHFQHARCDLRGKCRTFSTCIDVWMDGWMDESPGWMDGCMDVRMYGCMDVCNVM